ncbi:Mor transcription activator family protein [Vibrio mytili]|uniref:Mor transcription activator family protein n=1 Tax=Vibrio mytili TaxID=50718 RepID=UPI002F428BBD
MLSTKEAIQVVTAALDKNPELFSFKDIDTDTAEYPELLQDIYELFSIVLTHHSVSEEGLAFKLVIELVQYMGGIQVYMPKADRLIKTVLKKIIRNEFDGSNYIELSRRYRCTTNYIRRIVNAVD